MRQLTRSKSLIRSIVILFLSVGGFGIGILMLLLNMGLNQVMAGTIASQIAIVIYGLSLFEFNKDYLKQPLKKTMSIKTFGIAIGITFIAFIINIVIGQFTPEVDSEINPTEMLLATKSIWVSFILPVLVAPLVEELTFRAGLKHTLVDKGGWSPLSYIIISSVMFGLLHVSPGVIGLVHMGLTGLMGLLYSITYIKTDNIYITIISHMIYNLIIVTLATFIV